MEGENALAGGVNGFGALKSRIFCIVWLALPPQPNRATAGDSTQQRCYQPHWTSQGLRIAAKRVTETTAAGGMVVVVVVVVGNKKQLFLKGTRWRITLLHASSEHAAACGWTLHPGTRSTRNLGILGWAINFPRPQMHPEFPL